MDNDNTTTTITDAKKALLSWICQGGPDVEQHAQAYKLLCDAERIEKETKQTFG